MKMSRKFKKALQNYLVKLMAALAIACSRIEEVLGNAQLEIDSSRVVSQEAIRLLERIRHLSISEENFKSLLSSGFFNTIRLDIWLTERFLKEVLFPEEIPLRPAKFEGWLTVNLILVCDGSVVTVRERYVPEVGERYPIPGNIKGKTFRVGEVNRHDLEGTTYRIVRG